MASIFTYETEPVKVSSPWPGSVRHEEAEAEKQSLGEICGMGAPCVENLARYGIRKLDPEPQDGPVEYKLHLLLRPRRSFTSTSTVQKISGSYLSRSRSVAPLSNSGATSGSSSPGLAPSNQTRQNRLQHLTTQLLWRLQQSSPHYSSSRSDLVVPVLPDADVTLSSSKGPGPLVAGLEESQGALYEIGVSDDGTLVGLALDELEESLQVLRAMANSLGCSPQLLKTVVVGNCQWDDEFGPPIEARRHRREDLWVAEVLVAPHLGPKRLTETKRTDVTSNREAAGETNDVLHPSAKSPTIQLRISLTGSTTSGKSSLLGTLSTSTLDNGRGKSRLSLLRHRHEIVSGVTSSLAQELIGYHELLEPEGAGITATNIINYASGNTSSWTDIHNSSNDPGRLVFLTDSAGHPKFRRTTVRGLISCAPHWTLCCIAADDSEDSAGRIGATASSSDILGAAGYGVDLSKAHMELCLKLDVPLVCVITKLDLASRNGLRQTVAKVLSTVKLAGRKPILLAGTAPNLGVTNSQSIPLSDLEAVRRAIESIQVSERALLVPIVLTSAVTGAGIGQVHSLLRELPIANRLPTLKGNDYVEPHLSNRLPTLFHVDEIFALDENQRNQGASQDDACPRFILSGYVRYGSLQTGDNILIGPFSSDSSNTFVNATQPARSKSFPGLSKSLPKDLSAHANDHPSSPSTFASNPLEQHARQHRKAHSWHSVRIASLRYLRLPVRQLLEGQVGTVAISSSETLYTNVEPCLRRGMVICKLSSSSFAHDYGIPPAYRSITAVFADPNIYVNPGSIVTIYTASIRAPAKIVEVRVPEGVDTGGHDGKADTDVFAFDGHVDDEDDASLTEAGAMDTDVKLAEIEISFRFINGVEWVELGTKMLVTPASGISMLSPPPSDGCGDAAAGGVAVAGLDGFVGTIFGAAP